MTQRLYYDDSLLTEFEARVTSAVDHDGRPAAVLDRTAFYPTSGGQPFDTGRLGSVEVIETIDEGSDVVHIVSAPLSTGDRVRGEIDWARRFDHMQQHTGQHVLSAAFDRVLDNRTMSFHMGADTSTIDLAREASPGDVERCVDEANRIVWEDRPVIIRFASPEEAARLPLRKDPVREGPLRLIEVEGFDLSACGGTHVARTGEIGVIAVTAAERFRGGTRLAFVCGNRALRTLRIYRDAVAGSVRSLSVLPQELPAAVERVQSEHKQLRKTVGRMQASLAVHEATRLVAECSETQGVRLIVQVLDGWDAQGLKAIAAAMASQKNVVSALFSSAPPIAAVVARSPDLALDANAILQQLLARFGGRGGGKPDLAQGAGLTGEPAAIVEAARTAITAVMT
jgi:alanyl-tRNA synthetase